MKKYKLHQSHHVNPRMGVASLSIDADINGAIVRAIVDTGSDSSFLTNEGIATVGHDPDEAQIDGLSRGAGGTTYDLAIGGEFTVLGKSLNKMEEFTGEFIPGNDGLIGMDVLAQFKRVTFDLANKQLILED